jgi:hypothetical protein
MDGFFNAIGTLNLAFGILLGYWWVYIPILLFFGLIGAYQNYTHTKYLAGMKWILMEIRVPKEPGKSPKAMEQIFATLHGIMGPPIKWKEKFWKGKIADWLSFEIVGFGGDIHFYIRTPEQYKKLVEAQIYAQYPDTELIEVEDYISKLPPSLPDSGNDLWGAELILNKPDAYPIRTYPEFEEKGGGPNDVKRIDPLASLAEVLTSLDPGEYLGIQILIRPTGDGWVKKAQAEIDKLQGKKPKVGEDIFTKVIWEIDKIIPGYVEPKKDEKKDEKPQMTPGKTDALKAVENSLTKLGFDSGIRFMYAAPKDRFHRPHIAGVVGAFKQFSSQALNGFKINGETTPGGKWPFKAQQEYSKKLHLLNKFKKRLFTAKSYVLNTEELATIFHFPDIGVKTPLLPRVEAKKGEAPAGLPIS